MTPAEVVWLDAWVDTDDIKLKQGKKLRPIKRTTIGWLVAENEHGVVLVTDLYGKGEKYGSTPMVIGWNMIVDFYIYVEPDDE